MIGLIAVFIAVTLAASILSICERNRIEWSE